MDFDFWKILYDFFCKTQETSEVIEYSYEGLDNYRCVITAHKQDDQVIIVNLIDQDQWEMIVDLAEMTETDLSDVVRGLTSEEVSQIRLRASEFGL